jgi:cell division protein FtsI/penicillin-binding protein 2
MKGMTISAAIDLKKITPQTTFEDNGPVQYSDYVIDNWNNQHWGKQNIIQLLQKSNNIGAAWVGHLIGSKDLYRYFENFGIGSREGIDLEGEDSGSLRDYKTWTDIDLANISFGQGVSATPLQVLNAFNVIANGGMLVQPKIISKIIDENKTIDMPLKKVRRVISKDSSNTMIDLLEQAVSGGESKYYNLKNYRISGKTGTAQIPVNGKYSPDKTNTTFVGFPANSKKFSMIVRLDKPTTSVYASETASPLWMQITNDLVKYYGIAPDL